MHYIIYLSRTVRELSSAALMSLLLEPRNHNEQASITGALAYGDRQFMQVIEGEEAAVAKRYERIARNPHHQSVFKLADKDIAKRNFNR